MDISNLPSNILVALATGRNTTARDLLAQLIRREPQNAAAWLALAVTLPTPEAILVLRRVLVIEPDNGVALQNLLRLRQDDRAGLALSDVWPQKHDDPEEASPLFEHEQPTLPLQAPLGEEREARFGEEFATMPIAFQTLFSFAETAKPSKPAPSSSAKAKAEPEQTATATAVADPPAAPPVYKPIVAWPDSLPKPNLKPRSQPLIAAINSESYQPDFVSNSNRSFYPSPDNPALPMPRSMPKLQTGPRPQLGMTPEPMVGFTGFGVLIFLAAVVLAILALFLFL